MIVITTEEWIGMWTITISLCAASFFFGGGLVFMEYFKKEAKQKPINYPEKPVDKMYLAILDQIKNVKNASDLYAAYSSIIKFKYEFTGEDWLLGIVEQLYNQKEEEINKAIV